MLIFNQILQVVLNTWLPPNKFKIEAAFTHMLLLKP